jgi:hypothetical protein
LEQLLAGGFHEAASGETDVVTHLCHAVRRRHEALRFLVGGELGLREDQANRRPPKTSTPSGGTLKRVLDRKVAGSRASRSYSVGDKYVFVISP